MSSFQINGGDPPGNKEPPGEGYWFHLPEAQGTDGNNEPCGAVGLPWIEIKHRVCPAALWNWYCDFVSGDDLSAGLTSVRCYNPYKSGGAGWETFSGSGITIERPKYGDMAYGQYFEVTVVIRNLS